jgi:hypothetical protein
MNPRYKVIALIGVGVLIMAVLIHVNRQNIRETRPRGVYSLGVSMKDIKLPAADHRPSELNRADQVAV